MSMESASEFLVKVAQTDDLRTHCDNLAHGRDFPAMAAAIAEFGRTKGYEFTDTEAMSVMRGELSDSSLGSVSGGIGKMGGKTSAVSFAPPYTPPGHFKHR